MSVALNFIFPAAPGQYLLITISYPTIMFEFCLCIYIYILIILKGGNMKFDHVKQTLVHNIVGVDLRKSLSTLCCHKGHQIQVFLRYEAVWKLPDRVAVFLPYSSFCVAKPFDGCWSGRLKWLRHTAGMYAVNWGEVTRAGTLEVRNLKGSVNKNV